MIKCLELEDSLFSFLVYVIIKASYYRRSSQNLKESIQNADYRKSPIKNSIQAQSKLFFKKKKKHLQI